MRSWLIEIVDDPAELVPDAETTAVRECGRRLVALAQCKPRTLGGRRDTRFEGR